MTSTKVDGLDFKESVGNAKSQLSAAQQIQLDAKALGFDWPDVQPVFAKVLEELDEVKEAVAHQTKAQVIEELGDLLFAVVNLARHLDVPAEHALQLANQKFNQRFGAVKAIAEQRNINMKLADIDTLERIWLEVKSKK
ncbi:MazG nucleotide pyrophosphohydrolase domain-containing protein [Glaciecola siphonariae]|uniref:MazG nucleotide pyrophosphohydrolase domain-containing protein n=1 Tax=Glaciecola siphonariae TaxID=521012 RepID=A0ABV9LYP8_9ALTE